MYHTVKPQVCHTDCWFCHDGGVERLHAKRSTRLVYLQVTDDAERLGSVQSTGGGGRQLVGSANQQVPRRRVTAALRAHVAELREADVSDDLALLSAGEHLQS